MATVFAKQLIIHAQEACNENKWLFEWNNLGVLSTTAIGINTRYWLEMHRRATKKPSGANIVCLQHRNFSLAKPFENASKSTEKQPIAGH